MLVIVKEMEIKPKENSMSQHNTPQKTNTSSTSQTTHSAFELRPDLWDARYNDKERETLKAVALQYGLDPLTREVMILKGNIYVTASGLQKLAVRDPDYDGCEIEVVQADWSNNFFVIKARVWKKNCSHPFEDYGDADPSTSSLTGHALFRHAITRARARAMRSAFAIPFCSLEELDDEVRWRKTQRQQKNNSTSNRRPRQWADKKEPAQLSLADAPKQTQEAPKPKAAEKSKPKADIVSVPKKATEDSLIELATSEQQKELLAYAEKLDMTAKELADDLMQQYGVPSWDKLSNMQAQLLLELLKDRVQQHLSDKQNTPVPQNDQADNDNTPHDDEPTKAEATEHAETKEAIENHVPTLIKQQADTTLRARKTNDPRRMIPKPSRLEQIRLTDECVQRMEDADSLQVLRDEWENFQSVRHLLSAELIDRICKAKNERKISLSGKAA